MWRKWRREGGECEKEGEGEKSDSVDNDGGGGQRCGGRGTRDALAEDLKGALRGSRKNEEVSVSSERRRTRRIVG